MQQTGSKTTRSVVIDEPYGISAQELLRLGYQSKYGVLRKQGGLERLIKGYCMCLKWRQRYVVLCQGCVYIFKGDYSDRPFQSYSCRHFKRCERFHDNRMQYCFRVIPCAPTSKTLVFSCWSEDHRKEWMLNFKHELMRAHKTQPLTLDSVDTSEYVYLEEDVKAGTAAAIATNRPQVALPSNETATDSEDYSVIDESTIFPEVPRTDPKAKKAVAKPLPKQPLKSPSSIDTNRARQNIQKSKIQTPPTSPRNGTIPAVARCHFEYSGTDRDEVERLLQEKPEGTFLVRRSRTDNKEVLSVNIGGSLKEFKIYSKDNTVTINHVDYFTSVLELIQHYTNNNLPKKEAKLKIGYKDSGYVNRM